MIDQIANYILYHTPIYYLIQSVWRDEAFSYFMARPNTIKVILNTANDFNPPLYYLLLHFWINLAGHSDELLRLLSFLPHLAGSYLVYLLAKKMMSKRFAVFAALFIFLNPMLLYYAFEMRMYSFYAFFTIASVYFILMRNWKWYIVVTVLGLYTHSFFPLIVISYLPCLWITHQFKKKNVIRILKPLLFYIPWLPIIINQFFNSKNSWIYPVDFQLVTSSLGNLFTTYEGTPGNLWIWTSLLSVIILGFLLLALKNKKTRNQVVWILTPLFLPLVIVLTYSIFKKPIYVNRYMIFVTVFEILGIIFGIWSIKNKVIQSVTAAIWITLIIIINLEIAPHHNKTDFKSVFREINSMAKPSDYVYAKTPIGFLESAYYYRFENKVFVYNPNSITIPYYIGITVIFPDISKPAFPQAPSKTYLIEDNASYNIFINQ